MNLLLFQTQITPVPLIINGKYSLYEPREMLEDNKTLFKGILDGFLARYALALPELLPTVAQAQPVAVEAAPSPR